MGRIYPEYHSSSGGERAQKGERWEARDDPNGRESRIVEQLNSRIRHGFSIPPLADKAGFRLRRIKFDEQ